MKMLITAEWLLKKIESDQEPDQECEVASPEFIEQLPLDTEK
jgi:hypothetical protein